MVLSSRSPLGRRVSSFLQEAHPAGLSVSELFSRLVADQLYSGTKQGFVDMLAGNPDTYAKGCGGHWLDAALVAADGGAAGANELEAVEARRIPVAEDALTNERPPQPPGQFRDSYVIFDLETLWGDTREQRRIIEVSTQKFVGGAHLRLRDQGL
jgi:hypothetical protein